jgi:hypothetical protein
VVKSIPIHIISRISLFVKDIIVLGMVWFGLGCCGTCRSLGALLLWGLDGAWAFLMGGGGWALVIFSFGLGIIKGFRIDNGLFFYEVKVTLSFASLTILTSILTFSIVPLNFFISNPSYSSLNTANYSFMNC